MIKAYTQLDRAADWMDRYRGQKPTFVGALGFTETALIPGISAAGKTPKDRSRTAHADAEFLANGVCDRVTYPRSDDAAQFSRTITGDGGESAVSRFGIWYETEVG